MNKYSEQSLLGDLSDFFKMPVGIYWVKPNGAIIKATSYELNMLGYSPEELAEINIKDLFIDKAEINEILQKVRVGVDLQDYQTQLQSKDGSVRQVLINSHLHREDGKHIHTRFYVRDVSEQRRLELSGAFLSAIIEDSNDAIFSKDLDGTIISWNTSAENIFGYTATEMIGEPISKIIPDEHLKEVEENVNRIKQGERISHFETRRVCKDGYRLNVSLNMSPIKDAQGNIVGVSMIARDITKRKQAEAKLTSYQNQLRALVSKLNKAEEQGRRRFATELHDNLGQLLTMSKMKLDQLEKKSRPESRSPEINELRDLINEATDQIRKLMTELQPPPVLDQDHFESAIEWVATKMEKHGLKVDIESDKKPIPLEDEVQSVLLQSIKELLFNVLKYAGVDKSKVVISRKDAQVQVKVVDHGGGFDINSMDLASSKGRFGLFNIKERMELLGGVLEIHSEPEKGTTAELIAPLKKKEETKATVTDEKQPEVLDTPPLKGEQNGRTLNILLVDDHQIMREGIRKLIEAESDMVLVAEAANGKEAIELAKNTSPDVIIMDVNMPEINGIDATKKIVSDNPHITVIGLSVHNNEDVERSMKTAGASVFLSKSDAFELLCATIRSEARSKT